MTCSGADCCPPDRGRGCGWWAPVACSVIVSLFSMLRVFARFVRFERLYARCLCNKKPLVP
ncbi:hypothetical protein B1R27_26110 [Streptomyces sp. GKU 895]|nr:hypothetical protein B1R27_26110 [Streptomyces sp. GKU 895]